MIWCLLIKPLNSLKTFVIFLLQDADLELKLYHVTFHIVSNIDSILEDASSVVAVHTPLPPNIKMDWYFSYLVVPLNLVHPCITSSLPVVILLL